MSSISATVGSTAGVDFFELCLRRCAIVPEFQGCPGNISFVAVILFSEIRGNHEGSNEASKEGVNHSLVFGSHTLLY
jgi:hypothetical protein